MTERTSFEQELLTHGKIIHRNTGVSMRPLIRQGKDAMIIERPTGRLKKYDCPLYLRPDGSYVLHRILKVRESDYVICGDNCVKKEYGITDGQIIGVLTGVIRNGKTVTRDNLGYKIYYHLWCDLFYIRVAIIYLKRGAAKIFRLIFGRGGRK